MANDVDSDKKNPSNSVKTSKERKHEIKEKLNVNRDISVAPFSLKGSIQIQNASNIHLGHSSIVSTTLSPKVLCPPEPTFELTPHLEALMDCEDPVTTDHRLAVSTQVGSNWRFLGKELASFSNSQMDQLEEPFKANMQPFDEVIYQMLLKWEDHSKIQPSVGMLAKALLNLKMHSALIALGKVETHPNK